MKTWFGVPIRAIGIGVLSGVFSPLALAHCLTAVAHLLGLPLEKLALETGLFTNNHVYNVIAIVLAVFFMALPGYITGRQAIRQEYRAFSLSGDPFSWSWSTYSTP
jgi:hypothetical protein